MTCTGSATSTYDGLPFELTVIPDVVLAVSEYDLDIYAHARRRWWQFWKPRHWTVALGLVPDPELHVGDQITLSKGPDYYSVEVNGSVVMVVPVQWWVDR